MSFTRRTLSLVTALAATGIAVPGVALASTHAPTAVSTVSQTAQRTTPATVRVGSRGAGVAELQRVLTLNGFKVPATGYFGTQTKAAVIAYQKQIGIKADGVVGPVTWSILLCMGD